MVRYVLGCGFASSQLRIPIYVWLVLLELGLELNSTQKLAQELRFLLTLINNSPPLFPSNVRLPIRPLTCGERTSKPTCATMGDGGPQPIGSCSDIVLEMGLGPNSTQKLTQELRKLSISHIGFH